MLSLADREPSSPGVGRAMEQKAGARAPVASWQRGDAEAREGFGAGADGKPVGEEAFWRGLWPRLEVVLKGRRKVVALALGRDCSWDSGLVSAAWTSG